MMRITRRPAHWFRWVLSLIFAAGLLHLQASAQLPTRTALLPTAVTRPPAGNGMMHAASTVDLKPLGYVEEEYFVTGKANVYYYRSDGAVGIKTPDIDYTTRILVRRPANPRRFSGTVRVETMHPQYGGDFVWPRIVDYAISRGDAVVSISTRRGEASGIEAMKSFDQVRYAPINFKEDGLNWDVIGQVGRLLKTRSPLNPLDGYNVQRLTAQGWSGGGALLLIYISDGFHQRARMPGGGPIFDAYLVGEPSGYPRINSTAQPIPNTDPRQKVLPIDVPAISLHTRPQERYRRRPDGNGPNNRYRVYEVAGAAHNNRRLPTIYKQPADGLGKAGCVAEISWFPLHHYFKMTLARLDAWTLKGATPPPSQRMLIKPDGTPVLDSHGNPAGGVRSSYLGVPTARYFTNAPAPTNPGPSCNQDGAQERFAADKLIKLFRNHGGYVASVNRRVGELERAGWLLPADAKEVRMEAVRSRNF